MLRHLKHACVEDSILQYHLPILSPTKCPLVSARLFCSILTCQLVVVEFLAGI
jgi:hypothetical protein